MSLNIIYKNIIILLSLIIICCGGPSSEYEGLTGNTHYYCEVELCNETKQSIEYWQKYITQYKLSYGNYIKPNVKNINILIKENGFVLNNNKGSEGILCEGPKGFFKSSKNSIYICKDFIKNKYLNIIVIHEVGHSIGLSDVETGIMAKKSSINLNNISKETLNELDNLYHYTSNTM